MRPARQAKAGAVPAVSRAAQTGAADVRRIDRAILTNARPGKDRSAIRIMLAVW